MDKKLHLGCFDQAVPSWINTDITPHLFVARVPGLAYLLRRTRLLSGVRYQQHKNRVFRHVRYLDVTRNFPFADDSMGASTRLTCLSTSIRSKHGIA